MPAVSPTSVLGPDGPIARALAPSYEPRPQQLEMAAAVARALADKSRLLVEAGTGVGKSFAYLVPAILRCLVAKERIVIATNTISLQEQIIHKDVPLLQQTLPDWGLDLKNCPELIPVLVKGRGNYVSLRRLGIAWERRQTMLADAASLRSLQTIRDWTQTTTDGSLSTLPALESFEAWDHAVSDSDNCMGQKCPEFKRCFYQNARREMGRANLLICNHALYFSDLALRASHGDAAAILPPYQHLILDEAHNVEDAACDYFGLSLSQSRVQRLLRTLYNPRNRKGFLASRALALGDMESIDRATNLALAAEDAAKDFFDALLHLYESDRTGNGRLREPGLVENRLSPVMSELSLRLSKLREAAKDDADRLEIGSYVKRAAEIATCADAIVKQSLADNVYWIEVRNRADGDGGGGVSSYRGGGRGGSPRVTVACSPIDAAPILKEHLFSKQIGIVLTSATLATRSRHDDDTSERAEAAFGYTMSRLGVDAAATLQLGSPFNYTSQVQLHIDTTVPDPRANRPTRAPPTAPDAGNGIWQPSPAPVGDDPFLAAIADRVLTHVKATSGGAFVLFTSFAHLYAVADLLAPRLAELGLPMLVQNRDGSRAHILQRFRDDPRSVLLGAASFWQGVDVRGDSLRNVIIARLPFDPPDRPITQARLERITQRGGNAFMEESLPRAIIRFKQGFGRLIRSKTDTGRVVVLDPRIVKARYGRLFLGALPADIPIYTVPDASEPRL